MILNERLLQLVLTLAEQLHFGQAAAILHVSQPGLSGAVQKLERELGVRLFRRTSRRVELTETGQVFVTEARRLLEETERAVALVRGTCSEKAGPLRIGYSESINPGWICSLITFATQNRLLAAPLEFVSSEGRLLSEELMKGTLRAAFFTGPVLHAGLESVTLFHEPFNVVFSARHALTQTALLRLNQLGDEPVVWLRRDINPLQYDSFMTLCSSRGYHPNIVHEVRTFHECLEFARNALGVTFLPSFIRTSYSNEEVVFDRMLKDSLYIEHALAYRRGSLDENLERLIRFVLNHLPKTSLRLQSINSRNQ